MFGSVLLMVSDVFINLSFGPLPRHKAVIIITLKERHVSGSDKVGSPTWAVIVVYIVAHL